MGWWKSEAHSKSLKKKKWKKMAHIWSDKSMEVYLIILFKSHIKILPTFFEMKENACKIEFPITLHMKAQIKLSVI